MGTAEPARARRWRPSRARGVPARRAARCACARCRWAAPSRPVAARRPAAGRPRLADAPAIPYGINGLETAFARREAAMAGPVFGRWRGKWAFGAALPLAGAAEGLGGTDQSTPRRSTRCVQLHCVCARLEQRRHAMVPSGLPAARDGQCCVRGACSAHLQPLCAAQWSGASRHNAPACSPCTTLGLHGSCRVEMERQHPVYLEELYPGGLGSRPSDQHST